MLTISRLLTCRIVSRSYLSVDHNIARQLVPASKTFSFNTVRNMAQRSITLYFTKTPPKVAIKLEKCEKTKSPVDVKKVESIVTKTKEAVKRPRKASSDSDTSTQTKPVLKSPVVTSHKKKRVKRQRIESSGSESELQDSITKSPSPVKVKKEIENEEIKMEVEYDTMDKEVSSDEIKKEINSDNVKKVEKKNKKKKDIKVDKTNKKIKDDKTEKETKENKIKKDGKDGESKKSPKTVVEIVKEEKETKEGNQGITTESEYNPAKPKYHPVEDACWSAGAKVPYIALARTLELIEATSARLKVIEILSNYLRSVMVLTPEDLLPSIYMCLNQLAPAYHSLELGIAETYLMKAIGQCTGRTLAQVKSAAAKCGDLGRVAEQARATQRTMFAPPPLVLRSVFGALRDIAHMTGQASVNKKINKIQSLYVACRQSEARYLIRSLEGKLRIGLAEQSVLQALALATTMTPPTAQGITQLDASKGVPADKFKSLVEENALVIKTTYCECPNYEAVVSVLLQHGVAALPLHCRLTAGVPLKPMLAHPTRGVSEVFDRFEKEQFTCEWKYDGERAQIHVPGEDAPQWERAAIFSRNQEDNTSKYPDILGRLPSLLKESVKSCVLDCEAVAYDTETKQILPFQILSTRKRKDATESEIKVQVCVFVFDLLYLNGQPLVREPLQKRRELLREHFREHEGWWQFARSKDCSSVEEVQQFLEESVRGSCEGLMVKALDGPHARYDIARRSHNWLKLKKDYLEGVGDTLDVVVLGAYVGRGKRAGTFGGFLLACYEPNADEYQSLCKIGTGFSDEDLQTLTATLQQHVIDAPKPYYRFDAMHAADVWVEARCVWEVRCADLSLSPAHRAALGLAHPDKGVSLRFPRFIRVREDKTPEQATSAQQVVDMYLAQDQVKNNKHGAPTHADQFY